jgi:hypothetical protein
MASAPLRARVSLFAVAGLVAAAAACSAVFGLDAPTLDPCANGGCADGSPVTAVDGAAPPGSDGSTADASGVDADQGFDAHIADSGAITADGNGIRCGPADAGTYCVPPGACCLTVDGAGNALYQCAAGASLCPGYPIECAWNNDCTGTDVCCAYGSAMKCEPQTTASCQAIQVCDPANPGDTCPTNWTCTGPVTRNDGGVTLPYDVCVQ